MAPSNMLKFFGGVSGPQDQVTPKASSQSQTNPFDLLPSSGVAPTPLAAQRSTSFASLAALPPSGARTPTHKRDSTSTAAGVQASPGVTVSPGGGGAQQQQSFFGRDFGPGDVTPGGPATLGAAPFTLGGVPTTAISRVEPDFSFKTQPAALARRRDNSSAPKGKLLIKLIAARQISAPSSGSRPYVVVTFDQNEFVSREPVHEQERETTGSAKPKTEAATVRLAHSPGPTAAVALSKERPPRTDSPSPASSSSSSDGLPAPAVSANTSPKSSALSRALNQNGGGAMVHPTPLSPSPKTTATPITPVALAARAEENDDAQTMSIPQPISSELLSLSACNPTWKQEVLFDVMNEKSVVQVQIYDRAVEEEMFLGLCELRPKLVNNHIIDEWFPLRPRSEEELVTGEIRIQIRYEKFDVKRGLSVHDFDFLRMIGKGTFGRVFQVRKKDTKRIYAMKVLSKREIVAKKEVAHTIGERKILQRSSDSPFLLGLKFSFQSETDLYLIMDYKSGGELFHHLQKEGRFTEDRARFYTAEITLAFEHLHKFDIVYRDLKPENILLDATGHIVLCDFGLSKPDLPSDALTNTFCGTTEYLAPEVLLDDHGYSKLVDFWSLGVLLFEMCCGWSPFYAEDTQQMYKLICFGKVKFPRGVIGEDGKQFVKGLLNRNPKHRLGAQRDTEELKEHPFFKLIDWEALAARQVPPPFKPYVDSDESVANFDPEFTEANLFEEAPVDVQFDEDDPSADWVDTASRTRPSMTNRATPMEIREKRRAAPNSADALTRSVQENFRGFTFSGEGESMIHHAAGLFATTQIHPPSPDGLKGVNDAEEWEDEALHPTRRNGNKTSNSNGLDILMR